MFGDFSALDAACANADALGLAVDQGCGPLPQMSHTCAIVQLQILEYLTAD
jgi:hypothetical protein